MATQAVKILNMTTKRPPTFHFETALTELNALVESLEKGNLTLEESLKTFERGIVLTRQCQVALNAAEQKVKILLEKNGETTLVTYAQNPEEVE